ncbi:MAG: chromosome segregation protein SMC [Planctomycetaceae bacterium]|nr:chromosome segregation protein SMC [Planctomycetaceae bacterium]
MPPRDEIASVTPMFKALDIVGFKSFADHTRFEFPPGITVVVGPNGSGKSNIVDAIKWVLGEQSVKSLRGHEMADVIFNGSGARRALNTAEITLTLDNSKHLLTIDAPEVHITRRVYRGGEGEYLINRNPARLRDIRDLLSGTGMGTQAYSVIEQGKVDGLLQSSPRDRRIIFEEAAGISRFKVRKIEALRRLERVDQNLLRLADIVDEVENRLRSVRAQASKARRYKEHTDRLQELRTQVAQVDWRHLTEKLTGIETELQAFTEQCDAGVAEAEKTEAELLETDSRAAALSEELRQAEAQMATNRERIAAAESAVEHERNRGVELDEELARYRRQLTTMSAKAGDLQQQLRETVQAVEAADENHRDVSQRLADAEHELAEIIAFVDRLHDETEQRRAAYVQQMRRAGALANEVGVLESTTAAASAAAQRDAERMAELDQSLDAVQRELEELRSRRSELTDRVQAQAHWLETAKEQLTRRQHEYAARQNELAELRQRRTGAAERAEVLDDLVRRNDGVSDGVKEVLRRAADPAQSVFHTVCGLVADALQVSVEVAPLVEIALGNASQHVVATRSRELLDRLSSESSRLGGRVGFVWLDNCSALPLGDGAVPDLEGRPGVIGRADRFVQSEPRFAAMASRLLGRTWFVEKLDHALALSHTVGAGLAYVTLAGELLEPSGTLVVGPRNVATGLISRRSQLRALRVQLDDLDAAIQAAETATTALATQIAADQQLTDSRLAEHQNTLTATAENRQSVSAAEQRRSQLDQQRASLVRELQAAQARLDATEHRLAHTRQEREAADAAVVGMEAGIQQLDQQLAELQSRRLEADHRTAAIKIELAQSEERLRNLRAHMRQFQDGQQERERAIEEAREHLAQGATRAEASCRAILAAETEIADLYLRKETFASDSVRLAGQRAELQQNRAALAAEAQKLRARVRKLEEKIHSAEIAATEARHERTSLADRLREDYGIELAALEQASSDQEQLERTAVQKEIEELRQKINNLGNVNLEALDELDELETRHKTLADQYADLSSAKGSLEKIIERINSDSRRLFTETLETVRGHFQTLFRDLFGGGQADIVLEENVDILDSGVEIVARPPGKEPRSISLLSGGEKTMTCVALLLAIFRSRPSPFCVLDEVDAALDEANIDRFTQVLKDFTAWTQFIIVTHSKRTMSCANTIYGVTMQESGVTKQVSVRFEDISDDGEIITSRPVDGPESKAA